MTLFRVSYPDAIWPACRSISRPTIELSGLGVGRGHHPRPEPTFGMPIILQNRQNPPKSKCKRWLASILLTITFAIALELYLLHLAYCFYSQIYSFGSCLLQAHLLFLLSISENVFLVFRASLLEYIPGSLYEYKR